MTQVKNTDHVNEFSIISNNVVMTPVLVLALCGLMLRSALQGQCTLVYCVRSFLCVSVAVVVSILVSLGVSKLFIISMHFVLVCLNFKGFKKRNG